MNRELQAIELNKLASRRKDLDNVLWVNKNKKLDKNEPKRINYIW